MLVSYTYLGILIISVGPQLELANRFDKTLAITTDCSVKWILKLKKSTQYNRCKKLYLEK